MLRAGAGERNATWSRCVWDTRVSLAAMYKSLTSLNVANKANTMKVVSVVSYRPDNLGLKATSYCNSRSQSRVMMPIACSWVPGVVWPTTQDAWPSNSSSTLGGGSMMSCGLRMPYPARNPSSYCDAARCLPYHGSCGPVQGQGVVGVNADVAVGIVGVNASVAVGVVGVNASVAVGVIGVNADVAVGVVGVNAAVAVGVVGTNRPIAAAMIARAMSRSTLSSSRAARALQRVDVKAGDLLLDVERSSAENSRETSQQPPNTN